MGEYNMKMDLREMGCEAGDCIHLAEDRTNGGFT